jgi:predicted peptidase
VKNLILLSFLFNSLFISCRDDSPAEPIKPPVVTPPVVTPPVVPPSTNPLDDLPKDTGGMHKAVYLGVDSSPFGYYLYTPSGYNSNGPRFPLLVFLHGAGPIGNSQTDHTALDSVLVDGPPFLIQNHTWSPKYPMIVATPQCHEGSWDPHRVKEFIEFMMATYKVDTTRIYLTGLSMGGTATYEQLTNFGVGAHLAAAVPICGSTTLTSEGAHKAAQVPVWGFHGEADLTVTPDFAKALRQAINGLNPAVPAKLTMYPGIGHHSWERTYDGTGKGTEDSTYDPFSMEIYTWMTQYSKK